MTSHGHIRGYVAAWWNAVVYIFNLCTYNIIIGPCFFPASGHSDRHHHHHIHSGSVHALQSQERILLLLQASKLHEIYYYTVICMYTHVDSPLTSVYKSNVHTMCSFWVTIYSQMATAVFLISNESILGSKSVWTDCNELCIVAKNSNTRECVCVWSTV